MPARSFLAFRPFSTPGTGSSAGPGAGLVLAVGLCLGLAAPGAVLAKPSAASARPPSREELLAAATEATPNLPWELVATRPHDDRVFTEGLVFGPDGTLYESAGLYQASGVLKVDPASGQVISTRALAPRFFAEGLTFVGNSLYQLTWREHTLLRWSSALEPVQSMPYAWEGWGLTTHRGQLVASDGSEHLRFFAATGLGPVGVRQVTVTDQGLPLDQLNELEAIPPGAGGPLAGHILANVWHTPRVAVIDPGNGRVTGWLDLTELVRSLPQATRDNPEAVANGLAWDPKTGLLHVTGKLWPKRFVLRVSAPATPGPAAEAAPRPR